MSQPEATILLVGLSGSGKTNFLVALDVVLDDQPDADGLIHSEFASDRAYLQPLKEKWLRGEELDHTSRQQPPPPHQLIVRHPPTDTNAGFHLPDLAGENFDSHFETRSFPTGFVDRIESAAGLLLFLHCDQNADHAIHEGAGFLETAQSPSAPRPPAWRLEDASRQTKIVDLLQFAAEVRAPHAPLRIAVVVSAWDLIENAPILGAGNAADLPREPSLFVSAKWPLLNQFLRSQSEVFPFRVTASAPVVEALPQKRSHG